MNDHLKDFIPILWACAAGILCLGWALRNIDRGAIHGERGRLERHRRPIVFWVSTTLALIIGTYLVLAGFYFALTIPLGLV